MSLVGSGDSIHDAEGVEPKWKVDAGKLIFRNADGMRLEYSVTLKKPRGAQVSVTELLENVASTLNQKHTDFKDLYKIKVEGSGTVTVLREGVSGKVDRLSQSLPALTSKATSPTDALQRTRITSSNPEQRLHHHIPVHAESEPPRDNRNPIDRFMDEYELQARDEARWCEKDEDILPLLNPKPDEYIVQPLGTDRYVLSIATVGENRNIVQLELSKQDLYEILSTTPKPTPEEVTTVVHALLLDKYEQAAVATLGQSSEPHYTMQPLDTGHFKITTVVNGKTYEKTFSLPELVKIQIRPTTAEKISAAVVAKLCLSQNAPEEGRLFCHDKEAAQACLEEHPTYYAVIPFGNDSSILACKHTRSSGKPSRGWIGVSVNNSDIMRMISKGMTPEQIRADIEARYLENIFKEIDQWCEPGAVLQDSVQAREWKVQPVGNNQYKVGIRMPNGTYREQLFSQAAAFKALAFQGDSTKEDIFNHVTLKVMERFWDANGKMSKDSSVEDLLKKNIQNEYLVYSSDRCYSIAVVLEGKTVHRGLIDHAEMLEIVQNSKTSEEEVEAIRDKVIQWDFLAECRGSFLSNNATPHFVNNPFKLQIKSNGNNAYTLYVMDQSGSLQEVTVNSLKELRALIGSSPITQKAIRLACLERKYKEELGTDKENGKWLEKGTNLEEVLKARGGNGYAVKQSDSDDNKYVIAIMQDGVVQEHAFSKSEFFEVFRNAKISLSDLQASVDAKNAQFSNLEKCIKGAASVLGENQYKLEQIKDDEFTLTILVDGKTAEQTFSKAELLQLFVKPAMTEEEIRNAVVSKIFVRFYAQEQRVIVTGEVGDILYGYSYRQERKPFAVSVMTGNQSKINTLHHPDLVLDNYELMQVIREYKTLEAINDSLATKAQETNWKNGEKWCEPGAVLADSIAPSNWKVQRLENNQYAVGIKMANGVFYQHIFSKEDAYKEFKYSNVNEEQVFPDVAVKIIEQRWIKDGQKVEWEEDEPKKSLMQNPSKQFMIASNTFAVVMEDGTIATQNLTKEAIVNIYHKSKTPEEEIRAVREAVLLATFENLLRFRAFKGEATHQRYFENDPQEFSIEVLDDATCRIHFLDQYGTLCTVPFSSKDELYKMIDTTAITVETIILTAAEKGYRDLLGSGNESGTWCERDASLEDVVTKLGDTRFAVKQSDSDPSKYAIAFMKDGKYEEHLFDKADLFKVFYNAKMSLDEIQIAIESKSAIEGMAKEQKRWCAPGGDMPKLLETFPNEYVVQPHGPDKYVVCVSIDNSGRTVQALLSNKELLNLVVSQPDLTPQEISYRVKDFIINKLEAASVPELVDGAYRLQRVEGDEIYELDRYDGSDYYKISTLIDGNSEEIFLSQSELFTFFIKPSMTIDEMRTALVDAVFITKKIEPGVKEAQEVFYMAEIANQFVGRFGSPPKAADLARPGAVGIIASKSGISLYMKDATERSGIHILEVPRAELLDEEFTKLMSIKAHDIVARGSLAKEALFTDAAKSHVQPAAVIKADKKAADASLSELLDLFNAINFTDPKSPGYQDPATIMNDDTIITIESAREGLTNYITRISSRDPSYYGTPQNDLEASQAYYDKLATMAKQIIVHLRELQINDPDSCTTCLLDLAIAGKHCGGRFINATDFVYRLCTGQLSKDPAAGIEENVYQIVDGLKLGVVDAFVANVAARMHSTVDPNHIRNYVFKVINTLGVTLPGQDLISMKDEYESVGTGAISRAYENTTDTAAPVIAFFEEQFAPYILADRVQEAMLEQLKNDPKFESLLIGYIADKIAGSANHADQFKAAIGSLGKEKLRYKQELAILANKKELKAEEYKKGLSLIAKQYNLTLQQLASILDICEKAELIYDQEIGFAKTLAETKDTKATLTDDEYTEKLALIAKNYSIPLEEVEKAIAQDVDLATMIEKAEEKYKAALEKALNEFGELSCTKEELAELVEKHKDHTRKLGQIEIDKSKATKKHEANEEGIMREPLASEKWLYADYDDNFKKLYRVSLEAASFVLEQMGLIIPNSQTAIKIFEKNGVLCKIDDDIDRMLQEKPEQKYLVRPLGNSTFEIGFIKSGVVHKEIFTMKTLPAAFLKSEISLDTLRESIFEQKWRNANRACLSPDQALNVLRRDPLEEYAVQYGSDRYSVYFCDDSKTLQSLSMPKANLLNIVSTPNITTLQIRHHLLAILYELALQNTDNVRFDNNGIVDVEKALKDNHDLVLIQPFRDAVDDYEVAFIDSGKLYVKTFSRQEFFAIIPNHEMSADDIRKALLANCSPEDGKDLL